MAKYENPPAHDARLYAEQAAASAALAAVNAAAAVLKVFKDETATSMRAIAKSSDNKVCLKLSDSESFVGLYFYSVDTTDADDGLNVIRTTGESSGGWIKFL